MMPRTQQFGPGVIGAGEPINLDYLPTSWITATLDPISTFGGSIEVTLDDVFDQDAHNYVTPAVASWFPWFGAYPLLIYPLTEASAILYSTGPGPWRAIRLNLTANATGVIFSVAQATTPRA